jgi:hypothetical protein
MRILLINGARLGGVAENYSSQAFATPIELAQLDVVFLLPHKDALVGELLEWEAACTCLYGAGGSSACKAAERDANGIGELLVVASVRGRSAIASRSGSASVRRMSSGVSAMTVATPTIRRMQATAT